MEQRKKRVLIVVQSFSIGGTIVSLHSLLSVIDTMKYEIDLFALVREGDIKFKSQVIIANRYMALFNDVNQYTEGYYPSSMT